MRAPMNNMNFLPGEKISQLSDTELMRICRDCGSNIRKLLKEFAVLLLEIEKRRLYRAHDFHSIYEFAAKVAGMNHATVDAIIDVGKKLDDKPVLKSMIAECGWSKMRVIATVATVETQNFWAEKVKTLPKEALQTFVSEVRKQRAGEAEAISQRARLAAISARPANPVGAMHIQATGESASQTATAGGLYQSAKIDQSALFTNSEDIEELIPRSGKLAYTSHKSNLNLKLEPQTETNLRIFKQRLEKQTGEVQDWNFVMKKLLEIAGEHKECRIAGVATAKKQAAPQPTDNNQSLELAPVVAEQNVQVAVPGLAMAGAAGEDREKQLAILREKIKISLPKVSKRHIPAMVKKYLQLKYEGKCGFPNCKNPADIMHHVHRFILVPNHDPDKIVPLCKKHERLAHQSLIENEDGPPETWRIRMQPDKNSPKYWIDLKVNAFRKPP